MKIICIGHNYHDHNKEMNRSTPTDPVFFMKPDTALLRDGEPFYLPDLGSSIHYEPETFKTNAKPMDGLGKKPKQSTTVHPADNS